MQVQGMEEIILKVRKKIKITKNIHMIFYVSALEANALIPLSTFTLKFEKINIQQLQQSLKIIYNLVLLQLEL
jgi:hypothetical protein